VRGNHFFGFLAGFGQVVGLQAACDPRILWVGFHVRGFPIVQRIEIIAERIVDFFPPRRRDI